MRQIAPPPRLARERAFARGANNNRIISIVCISNCVELVLSNCGCCALVLRLKKHIEDIHYFVIFPFGVLHATLPSHRGLPKTARGVYFDANRAEQAHVRLVSRVHVLFEVLRDTWRRHTSDRNRQWQVKLL